MILLQFMIDGNQIAPPFVFVLRHQNAAIQASNMLDGRIVKLVGQGRDHRLGINADMPDPRDSRALKDEGQVLDLLVDSLDQIVDLRACSVG